VIRLYRADWSTNCERVALALAHKGLEVESVVISYDDRSAVEAVSGQGLVPVIEDGDTVVADSTAILRYLEREYPDPPLFPADGARRAEMDVFLDWFNEVWKSPSNALEGELELEAPDAERVERLSARLQGLLSVFERLLDRRDHLLGASFSAADCAAFPFLKYARFRDPADTELYHVLLAERQRLGSDHPRLAAWIDRVDARPQA
jgi:glutathione S-transferase